MDDPIHVSPLPLEEIVARLRDGTPFALSRWGDGEFQAVLGMEGETCDGQRYTAGLRDDLRRALALPQPYDHALGTHAMTVHGAAIRKWIAENGALTEWVREGALMDASLEGRLAPFLDALSARRVVYIGPEHLRKIDFAVKYAAFVPVSRSEAYADTRRVIDALLDQGGAGHVFLFSAGPAAKAWIDRLYPVLSGATLLDMGSLFDWWVGVDSRSYARRMGRAEKRRLIAANTRKAETP